MHLGEQPLRDDAVQGPALTQTLIEFAAAMDPDMTRFNEAVEENLILCRALVAGLKDTNKPLIATSGEFAHYNDQCNGMQRVSQHLTTLPYAGIALFAPTLTPADESSQRNPNFPGAR